MIKKLLYHWLIACVAGILLSSCRISTPHYNYKELAQASIRLGMDIEMKDNHRLYVESSKWMGVPYRNGGTSKRCNRLFRTDFQPVQESVPQKAGTQFGRPTEEGLPQGKQAQPARRRPRILPQRTEKAQGQPCGHLPEEQEIHPCKYQPGGHHQQPRRGVLPQALAERRPAMIRRPLE